MPCLAQTRADKKIMHEIAIQIPQLSADRNGAGSSQYLGYLEQQFRAAGLAPAGGNGYRQQVVYEEGKRYFPGTRLFINGHKLQPGKDFIPLPFSGQGTAGGEPLVAVQEQHLPWIMNIRNFQEDTGKTAVLPALYRQAEQAVKDKATAVLFYNAGQRDSLLPPGKAPLGIPVLYVQPDAAKRYFGDQTASVKVSLACAVYDKKDTAYNVIGRIDNHAASTIIVGGVTPSDKAALLQLARQLKTERRYQKENYVFVVFASGKGQLPALHYFAEHPPVSLKKVNCFINLNGAGRMKESAEVLDVSGTGSSEHWATVLDRIRHAKIVLRDTADAGCRTFYQHNIPAISVSSDASPAAAASAVRFTTALIRELNGTGKLSFHAGQRAAEALGN